MQEPSQKPAGYLYAHIQARDLAIRECASSMQFAFLKLRADSSIVAGNKDTLLGNKENLPRKVTIKMDELFSIYSIDGWIGQAGMPKTFK